MGQCDNVGRTAFDSVDKNVRKLLQPQPHCTVDIADSCGSTVAQVLEGSPESQYKLNFGCVAALAVPGLGFANLVGNFWMESERKLAHVYSFRTSSISCHESIFTLPESISFRRF